MKNCYTPIRWIALCAGALLLWKIGVIYLAYVDYTGLREWFEGNSRYQITAIKMEFDQGGDREVLRDLNDAIKRKTFLPGPGGYERATLKVEINGKHWGDLNLGCSSNSDVITIGIPSEFSMRPEFVFSNLKVNTNTADTLYRIINRVK